MNSTTHSLYSSPQCRIHCLHQNVNEFTKRGYSPSASHVQSSTNIIDLSLLNFLFLQHHQHHQNIPSSHILYLASIYIYLYTNISLAPLWGLIYISPCFLLGSTRVPRHRPYSCSMSTNLPISSTHVTSSMDFPKKLENGLLHHNLCSRLWKLRLVFQWIHSNWWIYSQDRRFSRPCLYPLSSYAYIHRSYWFLDMSSF